MPTALALILGLVAFPPPAGTAATPPTMAAQLSGPAAASPEEILWQRIIALRIDPAVDEPYQTWFAELGRRRQALLDQVHLYQTLYPGGAHQCDAVRLELSTLYELCALRSGTLSPLCTRVDEYLRDARPDSPVTWEAAYWQIICRRLQRGRPTTQPATAPSVATQPAATQPGPAQAAFSSVFEPDGELLAAYRDYIDHYPRSPYVPRMASAVFDAALQAGDQPQMQRLAEVMQANFPEHAVTASLTGQWQREQAVGHPFWLSFATADGGLVDTRTWIGKPVLIVVWNSAQPDSRSCVLRVEAFRRSHAGVRVVGVAVDTSPAELAAATAELGLDWPQFNDGLGWANPFIREWGVVRVPRVFVIDAAGRLAGSAETDAWKQLAAGL